MIRLHCACGRKIAAPDPWLGKRVKCPQCGKPVLVVRAEPVTEGSAPPELPEAAVLGGQAPAGREKREAQRAPMRSPLQPPSAGSVATWEKAPVEQEEDEFHVKRGRLPRFLGILGVLIAIGAAASCWSPQLDRWTLYIALAAVAFSAMGLGLSMSRYRVGLLMPVVGLIFSLIAMSFPFVLPHFERIAPRHVAESADEARRKQDEAADEAQRRGLLSVESLHLTGSKDSLAPELVYKLINRSGKTIQSIEGSIQLTDRDHRALGGLALNLTGPFQPNSVIDGKNVWPIDDASQQAVADNKFAAEYRARQVVYADGTVKNYSRP